jgi:hypothetical protein
MRSQDDDHLPDEVLIACGDTANKKVGYIWICDYHYIRFGVAKQGEEYFDKVKYAVDVKP